MCCVNFLLLLFPRNVKRSVFLDLAGRPACGGNLYVLYCSKCNYGTKTVKQRAVFLFIVLSTYGTL